MIAVRIEDPSQQEGYRYSWFNTYPEALAQVAHDQAREGRPLGASFFEGERNEDGSPNLYSEVEGRSDELDRATATERRRLENPEDGES